MKLKLLLQWLGIQPGKLNKHHLDDESLTAWLNRDFDQIRKVDPETRSQWLSLQRAMHQNEIEPQKVRPPLVPRFAFGSAIAIAAIVVSYFLMTPRQLPSETFMTEKGQQTRLLLNDSSEVTLNYASELVVPAIRVGKPRLLSLNGEAYFHVRKNNTPFIISTGDVEVRVVGTEFNVRTRDGMLEVAVIRGIVNVATARNGKESTLVLTANQIAVCSPGGFPQRSGTIPSVEYPGWIHGKLFLNATSFAAACREIEMRFGMAIGIDDQRLRNEVITGTLDAKSAETAITALCKLTGRTFRHDAQGYVVY